MNGQDPYRESVYYALALDPIHVGTGGYRLGEVDLTIVREPGTNLPKIPGSSLAGAARAYTAMAIDARERPAITEARYRRQVYDEKEQKIKWISCAGKGGDDGSEHCGEIDCPVCVTFGFTIGPQNRSFHGLAQFYDAQILFFPVHSMVGPVWVTSPGVLGDAGYTVPDAQQVSEQQVRTVVGLVPQPRAEDRRWGLNLGWLFLDVAGEDLEAGRVWQSLGLPDALAKIGERLVLLPEDLFSLVVDSNLEVRTSVSIDPATGAAEEGGLFTYEALPRGTVLRFSVVYHNPQQYVFPRCGKDQKIDPTPFPEDRNVDWLRGNVEAGLRLMEYLGVGGMSTRGFGRLRIVNLEQEAGGGE